ncbi:hypothetical protein Niako_0347 [Niastella koreensis GR20-10]|uniref:Uncharacterized protein n=1 Tax=Niastella koreensis (strain DSM 17620 / KACC 11465 / NBRC 106392 / GR20-10) TaxID=700598 RepID=G8TPD9_NIAKG|nr:hypothetical protein [Niastella koreensis]AEV96745.1 hypothetical protein Niako_0347 [Niastella koreensis GR20-10]
MATSNGKSKKRTQKEADKDLSKTTRRKKTATRKKKALKAV